MIQRVNTPEALADPWFVIWTESRAERKVAQRMAALGLQSWLPTVRERHRWSDRWREVECPLFPRYLFARARGADWSRILRTPGVLTVVREGGTPALVADSLVSGLRDALGREGVTPKPAVGFINYATGDQVIVQEGALRGVRGLVRERRGSRQLVIWVAAVGRGVAFTIESALVKVAGSEEDDCTG